jgi:hypothetical protein
MHAVGCLRRSDHMVSTGGLCSECALSGQPKSLRQVDGTIARGARGVHAAETPPDVPLMRAVGCSRLSDHMVCTGGLFSDCTLSDPPSPDMRAGGESGRRHVLAPGRPRRDQRCPGRLWPRLAPSARWCWWTLPRIMRRVARPAPSHGAGRERSSQGSRRPA